MPDRDIVEAYGYVMGRLLVARQQNIDFADNAMVWNRLVHHALGAVGWVNPCLDVVYSEAWVAVDEDCWVLLEIPRIEGRYYTWHMLNAWGETILNINERTFPHQPFGRYALCLRGSTPALPSDVLRVELPAGVAKVLARVELGADTEEAVQLQHQLRLTACGRLRPLAPLDVPPFSNRDLLGAEAFDFADAILAAGDDINPGMAAPRAALARVATMDRGCVAQVVEREARPALRRRQVTVGRTIDGWTGFDAVGNYGTDYWLRTVANLVGIWANNGGEYTGFAASALEGGVAYTQTYPVGRLPGDAVRYFWSVTAVDSRDFRVIPNPLDRHVLNNRSPLEYNVDGSLTLVFAPAPVTDVPEANWLPTPAHGRFNLSFRLYGPVDDRFWPPPLTVAG
jgi:hypothetical protein